jgi:ATP-dependent Clp protease ATP-binding subunit ClpA
MATLHVRNVPDDLYERLRVHADANGRSIGAEAVQLLDDRLGSGARHGRRRRRGRPTRLAPSALLPAAAEEADALGHDYVGTEHLLLAVLRDVTLPGLTHEHVREEVVRVIGRGDDVHRDPKPFTPRAKKALELARRAAEPEPMRLEHVALGLLEEGDGIAGRIMSAADPEGLRRALHEALERAADEPPFRVVELDGGADEWESRLNAAAADGYELVSVVERRALLRRA